MSRNNSRGAVGALHPILFFVFVYGISFFLAFFICSTVYNSLHPSVEASETSLQVLNPEGYHLKPSASATAMR